MDKPIRNVIPLRAVKELAAKRKEERRQAEIRQFVRKCETLYERNRVRQGL